MSRERISELIGSLEQQADKAVMVRIGFASIDRLVLDELLSACGTLRHLLLEDGRRHGADPGKCRSDLDDALGRLTFAWRQTASWVHAASPSG
ncbi:MAG: hypothetical protein DI607_13515 [Sphingomonas hengshuiensis]|nr:MAG: hypothetical protein DI607_13515 [Sphingomonas hengshuiensis]